MYSSFPFSPCFILSYQGFSLPLFFSLLTLYQRHFDELVSVLPPEHQGFSCPGFFQPRGYFSPTPASSRNAAFAAISCPLSKVFSLLCKWDFSPIPSPFNFHELTPMQLSGHFQYWVPSPIYKLATFSLLELKVVFLIWLLFLVSSLRITDLSA